MNFEIRQLTQEDWSEVKWIYEAGIATGMATFETEAPSYEDWIRQTNPACRLVIVQHQRVLGWCKLTAVSSRKVYKGVGEVSLYVHPSQKGKGLGNRLLKELIRVSEKEGFWTLQAAIFPENEASLHLHLKNGFRIVGNRERIGKLAGVWRDNLLLERRSQLKKEQRC